MNYDVVVVGGGAAGLAAAVTAADRGARTALVERHGFLGGMATAGMVGTICGLYRTSASGPPEPLNEGFAETFARRLMTAPGCGTPIRRGQTYVLPYTPFAFACLADDLGDLRHVAKGWPLRRLPALTDVVRKGTGGRCVLCHEILVGHPEAEFRLDED